MSTATLPLPNRKATKAAVRMFGTESPYNHGRRCLATLECSTKTETNVGEWQASYAVQMLLSTRSPVPVSLAGGEAETWAIDLRFLEAKSDDAVW